MTTQFTRVRILITGSRTWTDENTIREAIGSVVQHHGPENVTVVHGACPRGADAIADRIATAWTGMTVERHPADWDNCAASCPGGSVHRRRKAPGDADHPGAQDTYCPGAGPRRNTEMVRLGADVCLAFIVNGSRGAAHTADLAEKAGIPVRRFEASSSGQPVAAPPADNGRYLAEALLPGLPAGPQFADPAPPEAPARRLFDGFGRYLLPDPDTGKERAWTRVTTLAKTLEDTYNLEQWGARMAVKGMAMRPDLVAMAATLDPNDDDDKKTLNRLAKDAKEAAGSSAGANMGTALHKLTERVDGGERVDAGPMARELAAYQECLVREGVKVAPEYLERIICVPELGVAGRLDKLLDEGYTVSSRRYQVADLKTQKSMDFGGLGIAVQQAIYSRAYAIWDPVAERWENPPELDQVLATIIWLPVGRGICELFDVDLCLGWEWAQLSARVRGIRKAKPVTRRESMVPVPGPAQETPAPVNILDALGETFANAQRAGALPVSETISESGINATNFPANATSQSQMVARSNVGTTVGQAPGTWSGPDPQVPGDATPGPSQMDVLESLWEGAFRRATTPEELTSAGKEAMADFGGQLPDSLKALGRELRAKLTEHAPAA